MRSVLVVTLLTRSYLVEIELELACKRVHRLLAVSSLYASVDSVADVRGMTAFLVEQNNCKLKKMIVGSLGCKMTPVNGNFLYKFIRIVLRR